MIPSSISGSNNYVDILVLSSINVSVLVVCMPFGFLITYSIVSLHTLYVFAIKVHVCIHQFSTKPAFINIKSVLS